MIPFAIVRPIVKSDVWAGSVQMAGRLGFTPGATDAGDEDDTGAGGRADRERA